MNANTYAQALVQTALGDWMEQLQTVQRNMRRFPEFGATLTDPNAAATDREMAVSQIIPRGAAPEVSNFVRLLARNGDLRLLDEVVRRVQGYVPSLDSASNVVVTSAQDLNEDEKRRLEDKLSADYGEGLTVRYETDPDILGGLRIQVGDRVLDYSVASRLDAMRARLVG